MGGAAFKSLASARMLVGVMVAVTAAFVVSSATAQYVERESASHTDSIVANAMPSIQVLALVRGDLRAIDRAISRRKVNPSEQPSKQIAEDRRNMDAALASYAALPFFPDERAIYAPIPDHLRELDRELAGLDTELDDAALARCRDTIDAIDDGFQRLVNYDASQGQRLGLEIAQSRSRSQFLVLLLDAASVLLAIGAVALAFRQRARALHVVQQEYDSTEHELGELRTRVDELGQFAGRVAHDIRGPLQTTLLAVDLVLESGDERVELPMTRASSALQRMTVLVDGLLEFARAGGKPTTGATADLHLVEELATGLASDAQSRAIVLTAAVPSGARVRCTAGVLTSIVSNLARNAIRHMGDATVRRVDIVATDVGAFWRIEVRDSGPGIPPGEEQRIFQPHVQLGQPSAGIGLGLATVDRLVRTHAGNVGVISPLEGGATFWVELPKA